MCQKVEVKIHDKEFNADRQHTTVRKMECQKKCKDCQKKQEEQEGNLTKKLSSLLPFLVLGSITTFAQETSSTGKTFWDDPINDPMFPLYVVGAMVLITIILTVVVSVLMLRVLNIFIHKAAEEKAQRLGIIYTPTPSWWTTVWNKANVLLPLEEEKNIELDHNYDGIKELDNHLPPWWKGLFYGSIAFAVIYMVVYHFTDSFPLPEQEYQNELTLAGENARILRASQPLEVVDENTLVFSNDAEIIGKGRIVFVGSNCGSCHRIDGGGNAIGPNLTDEYWLHGGEIKNVFMTIKNGVIEKAMPAWGKVMSQKDVRDVAYYVMSLQGTKPDNAKAPQGELFKPIPPKIDSVRMDTLRIAIKK
ncbi:hypothetical protein BH09BAC3_BH09BAC3_14250 [soil metagenome]